METDKKRAYILIFSIFTVSLVYASIKVHILGNTTVKMLPLYTLNKAFAWTGLSLLAFNFTVSALVRSGRLKSKWHKSKKYIGKAAFNILGLHAIWTLLLFRTEYGLEFIWQNESIRAEGIVSIVLGSAALALLAYYSNKAGKDSSTNRLANMPKWILIIAIIHIAIWGIIPWFSSEGWIAYLPPSSLLACITACIALWVRIKK